MQTCLSATKAGIYCIPGDFYIDPNVPVPTAIISHGHADHALAGHNNVYAHKLTVDIMKVRYMEDFAKQANSLEYFQKIQLNDTTIHLVPAGHILGSAQIVIDYQDKRYVVSGDYKRTEDPTCLPFVPVPCDLFVTEATFALPVFKHPDPFDEINKLLTSIANHPNRCHLVGVYILGKCQRIIKLLRMAGYKKTIYLHGALEKLCALYQHEGIDLGDLQNASVLNINTSAGNIVLCPPHALHDRWSRRFGSHISAMASGWMQIRARAKQKKVELPLVISDHADWPDLIRTIQEVNPKEVWITHGQEEALAYHIQKSGFKATPLHLLNYDEAD